jgi:SAM-dependent methyltransferase
MKNIDQWYPSKFIYKNGKLKGSRNSVELQIPSRLLADIVADHYHQYLKYHATGKLIDLGCGKVPLYEAYKGLVDLNICVDWENTFHKNPFIDKTCDLNDRLPFDDGEFDTVLLSDVLEHIATPETLWNEMSRILRPRGKLILNVPFYYKIHEMPHDYYRYTEFALRRFAINNGFHVLLLKPMGGVPEIMTDLAAKMLVNVPLVGKVSAMLIQYICQVFLNTRTGKKLSSKTGVHYPVGYFLVAEKSK